VIASLIEKALAAGVTMRVDRDLLVLSATEQPDDGLLQELRAGKTGIVQYLSGLALWTVDDWQALYDERAGIMEFDGGMSREDAETAAAAEVARLRRISGPSDG
jgi:hypothetical protein